MTAPAPSDDPAFRARAVAEARRWLGTPYRHQACRRGVGVDCLGLIRGVWRALGGPEPTAQPPYTPDWSEFSGRERLLVAARAHLIELPLAAAAPGDVVVFRLRPAGVAKHAGLLSAPDLVIHAYSGHGVVETPLEGVWRAARAAAFRFPPLPNTTDVDRDA